MLLFVLQIFILLCTLNKLEYVAGFDIHRHSAPDIQGTDADVNDFPYYAGMLFCGATILSESWVVTAAHCISPATSFLNYVWVGGDSYSDSNLVTFNKVVFHNQMKLMSPLLTVPLNDIALLHLIEPLVFTDKIRPIDLPHQDLTRSNADSKLMFVGRGVDENGDLTKNLQNIEVVRLSTEECLNNIPEEVQREIKPYVSSLEKMIGCTKRPDGAPGMCQGESGSPLTQGNTLVGITSFIGAPCDVAKLGFFVNIENYVPWIKSVISSSSGGPSDGLPSYEMEDYISHDARLPPQAIEDYILYNPLLPPHAIEDNVLHDALSPLHTMVDRILHNALLSSHEKEDFDFDYFY